MVRDGKIWLVAMLAAALAGCGEPSASEDSDFPANSRISRKFGLIMSTPCSIAAARGAPDVSRKNFAPNLRAVAAAP